MSKKTGFYAYPAIPKKIGETIERGIEHINSSHSEISVSSWKSLDVVGHFIAERVLSGIDYCELFFADISHLNFNVIYEIGYAIGKGKRIFLTKNISIVDGTTTIREVGIFDTLGYFEYQNSVELSALLDKFNESKAIDISSSINTQAPVYLLDTKHKTDWSTKIVSRIKKSGYIFRSFDPNESPRLSAYDAISHVSQSFGVIVPLLSPQTTGADINNKIGRAHV